MKLPVFWQCGQLTARKVGDGCSGGDVDTSSGDIYQQREDGCFWKLPIQTEFYTDDFYLPAATFYVKNNTVVCPT